MQREKKKKEWNKVQEHWDNLKEGSIHVIGIRRVNGAEKNLQ